MSSRRRVVIFLYNGKTQRFLGKKEEAMGVRYSITILGIFHPGYKMGLWYRGFNIRSM